MVQNSTQDNLALNAVIAENGSRGVEGFRRALPTLIAKRLHV
jgi:hypothetical protein